MPRLVPVVMLFIALGCTRSGDGGTPIRTSDGSALAARGDQPPVAVNATSPVMYPAALARERIEGTVLVRLHIDSTGRQMPDSIGIAESSGYPALDSAAVAGASGLRFAPALRRGQPIAATFIQPIQFRAPGAFASP